MITTLTNRFSPFELNRVKLGLCPNVDRPGESVALWHEVRAGKYLFFSPFPLDSFKENSRKIFF